MSTVNGIGATYYGCDDLREDGSYVATSYFVVLFLPIIPLGTARLRHIGLDSAANHYQVIEKLPLHRCQVTWTYLRCWLLMPLILLWPIIGLVAFAAISHAAVGKSATSVFMKQVAPVAIAISAVYFIAMAAHLLRRARRTGLVPFPDARVDRRT